MTYELRLPPETAFDAARLRRRLCEELGLRDERRLTAVVVRRRSIDARQRTVMVNLSVDVYTDGRQPEPAFQPVVYPVLTERARVAVVVGAGPAGLFAALRLIELGVRPVVVERGQDVHQRRRDIALISREHRVLPESNYCFGEGGAGAYSDGKLFTRSKKRGSVESVLRVLCQHGASPDILVDAHPHIGTDRLPRIIEALREQIRRSGGEVHFGARAEALLTRQGATDEQPTVCGVRLSDGRELMGPVILATGHSARDVYRMLRSSQVPLQAKGLAVGVRLEHPAQLIDCLQYHSRQGRGRYLPAAEYSYVAQAAGRGVYSFCMCPGGFVVPAASGPEQVVVNGMSPSSRAGRWSNSGMVVETRPEDLDAELRPFMQQAMADEAFSSGREDWDEPQNPLRMMYFQEALERAAWQQGGRRQSAPAQRMTDFTLGRLSAQASLPESSYAPGLTDSPLHFWMPRFVVSRLQEGFRQFGRRSHGFLTEQALCLAVETRTSSPLRCLRHPELLSSLPGLYPCGEGAGFAGGIVSAAIDGQRCAEALAREL